MSVKTDSMLTSIKALDINETFSRATRLPLEDLKPNQAKKALSALRNVVNQAAVKAGKQEGMVYKVESGLFLTFDGTGVMIVVTVTCAGYDAEDDI